MKISGQLTLMVLFCALNVNAQNYSAIHGSNYSGALGVYNNPSSIVTVPFKWDVTVLGAQYTTITNAVRGPNFPLNLSPSSDYSAAEGNYKRYGEMNFNTRLLNARISIDRERAFAFGINLRGYGEVNTSQLNYTDSVIGPRSFLFLNQANGNLSSDLTSSLWMELYGSYGMTLLNTETSRLNAGATVKILRTMSGAFARVGSVGISTDIVNDQAFYKIINGTGQYGYSANHGDASEFSASDLFSGSRMALGIDLGVEYIIKTQAVASYSDELTEYDYDWKIGLSLLDIDWNKFAFGSESRSVSDLNGNVTSLVLNERFSSVQNFSAFNDSLATIVHTFDTLTGDFRIANPMRAVFNADRFINGNFYVNAELSLNLASEKETNYAVKESRLLSITPRWESRNIGVYIPVQVTNRGNFWIGGAFRAGPLLVGTHNLLNAFLKNKYIAGGAYIAFTIKPSSLIRDSRNQQYECPEF